jgi:hypothetical protein
MRRTERVRYRGRYMGCYSLPLKRPWNRQQLVENIAALHVALHCATPRYATAPYKGAVALL